MSKRGISAERDSIKRRRHSAPSAPHQADEHLEHPAVGITNYHLPSPSSGGDRFARGRKRNGDGDQDLQEVTDERHAKRPRYETNIQFDKSDPVKLWLESGFYWSGANMEGSVRGSIKRTLSSSSRADSYNKAALKGIVPKPWTRQHATAMHDAGIYMNARDGATIAQEDKQLCEDILEYECELPKEWSFKAENFSKILLRVSCRNEAGVEQHLCPIISPSAEMLHDQGYSGLDFVGEGTRAGWSKTSPLHGPKPTPDATWFLLRRALTPKEQDRLTLQMTAACENGVLPFYLRQTKCMGRSIEEAELQALHNASVAANTVVELYQSVPDAVAELHRRVLAFSMVHNHHVVRIHGHFIMVEGDRITFHRQLLFKTDLDDPDSDPWRPFKISVGIYRLFGQKHLDRVKDVISRLPDRAMDSFAAALGLEEDGARTVASTPTSSQEEGRLKRPSLSMTARIQEDNARLRDQMGELTERLERQLEQQRQESREQREALEKQLEQQRQESREQLEQQRQESREQREALEKQLEQQRQESLRQLEQQRQESLRQLEQQRQDSLRQHRDILALLHHPMRGDDRSV